MYSRAKLLMVALLGTILLIGSGCATTRIITAHDWVSGTNHTLYVAYWEGNCIGTSCSTGTSKIKQCVMNPRDNSLVCRDAEAAEQALN